MIEETTNAITTAIADSTEETTNILEVTAQTTKENISHVNKMLSALLDFIGSMLPSFIFAVIVLAIGILLSKIALKIVAKALKRTKIDPTVCGFVRSLVKIILYVIVFVIFLSLINVPMTSIITSLGTAGLAVGLAVKDSLSNVAGGFIILFAKPLKAGDVIEFNNVTGKVQKVGIFYTTLITYDNATVYIPNGKVSEGQIINYSEQDIRRVDLEFSVSYSEDIDKVKNVLKNIVDNCDKILKDPSCDILLARHDDSAIVFYVRPWVKTEDYWTVDFYLREEVKREFDKNNIEIPFNQLDVHNV